ncbi:hypothetical protein [Persephonella sp.]
MKTINTQDLLRFYRIDVEHIDLDDTFELEDLFFKRKALIERFNTLTVEEVIEFFRLEKQLQKFIPQVKKRYPRFYEKVIKPTTDELYKKLETFKSSMPQTVRV